MNFKQSYWVYILFICIISFTGTIYAESNNIGKIDLCTALILHPKMSLFDYKRLGFYKTNIGLSEKDFNKELSKYYDEDSNKKAQIKSLKDKIRNLSNEIIDSNIIGSDDKKDNLKNIEKLQSEIAELRKEIQNLEFELNNNEITNFIETRKILSDITLEIIEIINEIGAEQNLSVVFNDSVYQKNTFPSFYISRKGFYNNGGNGWDNSYYIFLTNSINAIKTNETPSSVELSNWFEFSKDPELLSSIPLKKQPFVIYGAKDILHDVIKKIYSKYNISSETTKRILNAIN